MINKLELEKEGIVVRQFIHICSPLTDQIYIYEVSVLPHEPLPLVGLVLPFEGLVEEEVEDGGVDG